MSKFYYQSYGNMLQVLYCDSYQQSQMSPLPLSQCIFPVLLRHLSVFSYM